MPKAKENCGVIFESGKLFFVGQDCLIIPSFLYERYGQKVTFLDLSFNCLTSLQGIQYFPNIEELILDNNSIVDSVMFPMLPKLHTLSMNKNKIRNLDLLLHKLSTKLPSLFFVSLLGNPACPDQITDQTKDEEDYQRYRFFVLHNLPNLKYLDSKEVTVEERCEAQKRGKFFKVVRPDHISRLNPGSGNGEVESYSPLPVFTDDGGNHEGAYGKCRYRYSGKNSEGNRFIHNKDL